MDEAHCRVFKHDTDFSTSVQLPHINSVGSALECQARCNAEPRCDAWTWGEALHIPGVSHVCFPKAVAKDEEPREIGKPGVVSGVPCREPSSAQRADRRPADRQPAKGQPADPPSAKKQPACKTLDGMDFGTSESLPPLRGVTSAEICQAACRSAPGCEVWTWGKVRHMPGLTDGCFMKKLAPGEKPKKIPKAGVVSGYACSPQTAMAAVGAASAPDGTTTDAPALAASTRAPGKQQKAQQQQKRSSELYCFTLSLPFGREAALLRRQHQEGAGLFACDGFAVYSNESFGADEGLHVRTVQSSLRCETGGELRGPMNRGVFSAVWKQVLSDGRFWLYSWTVKVDPDTVFFPSRLRPMLHEYKDQLDVHQHGLYLNNCRFGLRGAIEVFSSAAVQALGDGWRRCEEHFHDLCAGDCGWGEDLFADQCLSEVLRVRREYAAGLLVDKRCEPLEGWQSCQAESVAFHPFTSTAVEGARARGLSQCR